MGFIKLDARIEQMALDCWTYRLYARIVFHARGSNIGHIESQQNTAIIIKCSTRQIIRSLKILTEKNMIEIEKYGKNKNKIVLTDEEKWNLSSDCESLHNNLVVTHSHHSSDCESLHPNTISVTRSIELDVCKKPHTQKSKKPNFKTAGIALAESIRKSFGDRFFQNEIAIEIVVILFDEKISISDIELITHDIEKYKFLTSKLKNDIIDQMKNWLNRKKEFIAQRYGNNILQEEIMEPKVKKLESGYFSELPEDFKSWFNTLDNLTKTSVKRDIKKYTKEIFINTIMPNYFSYRNFIKRAS